MSTQPLEPRVRRLENDVTAIYDLLGEIQATVTGLDARLAGHDARFDAVDARFDTIDAGLDTVITLLRGTSEPPA